MLDNKEEILSITSEWTGERFPDGRPKVPDRYLDALYKMTLEELWKPVFTAGYTNQFIAMKALHPEFTQDGEVNHKMVGRAVTAVYAPTRPDYYSASCKMAEKNGWQGLPNQWVMDRLSQRDVLVVDMYDKIYKGTFVGGNLTTALRTKTGNGGAVIWGGIRDVEQMQKVKDIQVYYRGIDPTPIRDFVMTGLNTVARLGDGEHAAVCLPGDVVYGCSGGVLFIPPQLVVDVVENGQKTKVKDMFGFKMISENKFTTAQIDRNVWTREMLDLLREYIRTAPEAAEYRDIDWTKEYELAMNSEDDQQSSL